MVKSSSPELPINFYQLISEHMSDKSGPRAEYESYSTGKRIETGFIARELAQFLFIPLTPITLKFEERDETVGLINTTFRQEHIPSFQDLTEKEIQELMRLLNELKKMKGDLSKTAEKASNEQLRDKQFLHLMSLKGSILLVQFLKDYLKKHIEPPLGRDDAHELGKFDKSLIHDQGNAFLYDIFPVHFLNVSPFSTFIFQTDQKHLETILDGLFTLRESIKERRESEASDLRKN